MDMHLAAIFVILSCLVGSSIASYGDSDLYYRLCLEECNSTGCVGKRCFPHCKLFIDNVTIDGPWYMKKSLYLRWKQWDCEHDCRYYCMMERETERAAYGYDPLQYHGKWPFTRVFGMQEPASVVFSAINLAMHYHGWKLFFILLYHKLPLKHGRKAYYEYASLWHIYALFAMNSWIWSAVFHSRDMELTERLDYSSAVALLGFSLIIAIIRAFRVRTKSLRVMISAPLAALITAHIFYLNMYPVDYGWNLKVCAVMGITQILIWSIWARIIKHPSRMKLWFVTIGGAVAMLLEIFDFPPIFGLVDAHALWHAATIPLTYFWWSFIRDDAKYRTSNLLKIGRSI